jgi:2-polyprenyl-6-methoxyphenol hydroxylase-like FAD-dependent oxidoreductase
VSHEKITIIGAGVVGVATASYLKGDDHDITLVDLRPPRRSPRRLGDRVPLEAERGYHVTHADSRYTLSMPVMMPEHKSSSR